MKVKILDVNVENIVKGKSRYSKAAVTYTYNGEARTQNIMSFTNPAIFKAVQEKVGQEVEITITKNAAGYNEWASLDDVGSGASPQSSVPTSAPVSAAAPNTTRVTGSNYETATERAAKQVYIVKQSSLSSAIALTTANKEKATPDEVIAVAQKFVDFVFDSSIESMKSDEL